MTRTYLTRHGAGPLPFETVQKPFSAIVDDTNIPNAWQGVLRFAPWNFDLLQTAIRDDLRDRSLSAGIEVRPRLGITCVDQAPEVVPVVRNGELCDMPLGNALRLAASLADGGDVLISRGPTRRGLENAALPPIGR